MKRILQLISFSIITMLLTAPIASGQEENVEKKVEKRVKIVTVDKDGNKVVLDTTITDETDLSEIYPEFFKKNNVKIMSKDKTNKWKSEDGSVYIMKSGDGESFSFYSDDKGNISKEKNVHIIKKGDGETFSIVKVGEGDEDELHEVYVTIDDKNKKNVWVSKDQEVEDGKVHIIIRSKGEVEEMVIDGDAVITIKDGKVTMEGDKAKLHSVHKKGEEKVLKEVQEKKVVKKKKK